MSPDFAWLSLCKVNNKSYFPSRSVCTHFFLPLSGQKAIIRKFLFCMITKALSVSGNFLAMCSSAGSHSNGAKSNDPCKECVFFVPSFKCTLLHFQCAAAAAAAAIGWKLKTQQSKRGEKNFGKLLFSILAIEIWTFYVYFKSCVLGTVGVNQQFWMRPKSK